ncbi:MAG: hypothetical protein AAB502_07270 [Chloroflexota bacterium]
MHYVLLYDYVEDVATKRAPHREEHVALVRKLQGRGELLIAGAPFVTVSGTLPTVRDPDPPPNVQVKELIAASARAEVGARR